jgi:hypothetical protein
LENYFANPPPLPTWADADKLHHSADFFDLNALTIGTSLFCASLPEAYAGARGARVLTLSARMVTDPVRRVYETAQMVFDSMQLGGLEPGTGAGYHDIQRVRLMHAAVRYLVLNDPDIAKTDTPEPYPSWCIASGLPINQEDMLGTLMTFTVSVFESLDKLGIVYSNDDADAYLHAWCVAGDLMGIRADLLPLTLDDAHTITAAIRRRQTKPSDDARLLAGALVGAMQSSMRVTLLHGLPPSIVRFCVGPDIAAIDGVDNRDGLAFLFDGVAVLLRQIGLAEQHNKMLRVISRHVGAAVLDSFVRAGRTGSRPPFSLPTQLDQQVRDVRTRWSL